MKTFTLILCLLTALAPVVRAADKAPTTVPPKGTLPLVIWETLGQQSFAITEFDRLDLAFRRVSAERKWPLKVVAERFAANVPDYTTELEIVPHPLLEESGALVFRGWTTLTVDGKTHDFGVIFYRAHPRPGENREDAVQKVFDDVAREIANKVEPLLFPKEK